MKREIILVLCIALIIFNIVWLFKYNLSINFMTSFVSFGSFILNSLSVVGRVFINLGGETLSVSIDSPENITYNFSMGETYTLGLNVSANKNVTLWRYDLYDLTNGVLVQSNVAFIPNTTFDAVRYLNKIVVYAQDDNEEANESVIFFVYVPNSAPLIINISPQIYACEGTSFSYSFNALDMDNEILSGDIFPKNPFYLIRTNFAENITSFEIISGILSKSRAGGINAGSQNYSESVSVYDSEYSDTKQVNITVIEINNGPVVQNIGVKTIWLQGDNSTFYEKASVLDIEDGNESSGNFEFNLTFLNSERLFEIDSEGIMNFSANESQIGVYNLSLCVSDRGISNPHLNISLCNQTGQNITTCQNFSITITNENRKPTITSYYPLNLTSVGGTDTLYFNISSYDPDGTIPDVYWYVDNISKEYDSGMRLSEFTYSFGCGVSGEHSVKVIITDGLLNDSVLWDFDVAGVDCVTPLSQTGGGGGGAGCAVNWVCDSWNTCQNSEKSLSIGILSGLNYRKIKELCIANGFDAQFCGFQIRRCFDLNSCNLSINKPIEIQQCLYSQTPSCNDGIQNCHSGDCELLVDCGGPCKICPSCSDNLQNQGEEGVDCGGPCPNICILEKPFAKLDKITIFLFFIIGILLIFIIIKTIKIIKYSHLIKKHG